MTREWIDLSQVMCLFCEEQPASEQGPPVHPRDRFCSVDCMEVCLCEVCSSHVCCMYTSYVTSIISPVQWWFVCGMKLLFGSFHAAQLASFGGHGCSAVVPAGSLPTHALLWHRSPQRLLLVPVSCHASTVVCVAVEVEAGVAVVSARFAHLSKHHVHAHIMSYLYNVMRFSPNTPCDGNGMHRSLSDAGRTFTTTLHHVHVLFSVSSHGSRNDDWYTRATTGARFSKQQHFSPAARPGQRPRRVLSRRVRPRLPGTRV